MKRKTAEVLSLIFALILIIPTVLPGALSFRVYAVSGSDIESSINGIIKDELAMAGAGSVQELLNGKYTEKAGVTSDWFVFSLVQYAGSKYDYSSYARALNSYAEKDSSASASTKERYALNLAAMGTNSGFIKTTVNNEIGKLGIMSYIFGLHLISNGYTSSKIKADEIIKYLLSVQYDEGGWALNTDTGTSDVDITSMTVQCLAPYYAGNSAVKEAVDRAISLLSSRQLSDGGFSSYYSTKNPESAAQVIVALTSLGINPLGDARFIKNGRSPVDSMLDFKATDYGYSHTSGGKYNVSATTQVLYSLVSIYRLEQGKGRLYDLNAGVKTDISPASTSAKPSGTAKPSTSAKPANTSAGSYLAPETTKKAGRSGTKTTAPATTEGSGTTAVTQPVTRPESATGRSRRETTARGRSATSASSSAATSAPATTAVPETAGKKADSSGSKTTAPAPSGTAYTAETLSSAQSPADISGTVEYDTFTVEDSTGWEGETDETPETVTQAYAETEFEGPEYSEEKETEDEKTPVSLKQIAVIAVWSAAALACAVLIIKRKRKPVNFIIIAAAAALITAGIMISDIQRPGEYYSAQDIAPGEDTIAVTMSIDCKTVAGRGSEEVTPADGIILESTEFILPSGSTAYDCLVSAAKKYNIQFEDSTRTLTDHSGAYISGINFLYEFNYGDLSGWMFSVNGDFGDVGCGEYTLSDGDNIEWRYTTNLGEDLK